MWIILDYKWIYLNKIILNKIKKMKLKNKLKNLKKIKICFLKSQPLYYIILYIIILN